MPDVASAIRFHVLGSLEVWRGEARVAIAAGKQRQLLCLLIVERDREVSTDRIVDGLWEGSPPVTAAKAVQVSISSLRRSLADERTLLVTTGRGYRLAIPRGALDVDVFAELVEQGRGQLETGSPEAASATLRRALALWRGQPFADVDGHEFARAAVAHLEDARMAALEDRIEADLACGRHRELTPELESLCVEHPTHERLRGQLMTALSRSGRQARALEAYDIGRRAMADELGIEPGEPLQQLHLRILRREPELAPPDDSAPTEPKRAVALPPVQHEVIWRRRPAMVAGGIGLLLLAVALLALLGSGSHPAATAEGVLRVAPNSVVVIDIRGRSLLADTRVGRGPSQLVAGGGSVWVLNGDDGTVGELDPTSGRSRSSPVAIAAAPSAIAFAGGSLWVGGADGVFRVDPEAHHRTAQVPVPGNDPDCATLDLASDGSTLWAERIGVVYQILAATAQVRARYEAQADRCSTYLGGIAVGPDAIWLRGYYAGLVRVAKGTGRRSVPMQVPVSGGPIAVWGLRMWVADRVGSAIDLFDTSSGRLVTSYPLPSAPTALAALGASLWVVTGDGWLVKIDAATGREQRFVRLDRTPTAVLESNGRLFVAVI